MKRMSRTFAIAAAMGFVALLFVGSPVHAAAKDAVAVLFQVKGDVTYQKPGKVKWKKVRRNKFLFPGYKVRSGTDGSGKFTNLKTGANLKLGPDTTIDITKDGPIVSIGILTEAQAHKTLAQGVMRRFKRAQSYTTVRRSKKDASIRVVAARHLVLSEAYPELVWGSAGSEYDYRLTVGDRTYEIGATVAAVVRAKISPFEGEQAFKIEVLRGDQVVASLKPYKKRGELRNQTLTWLSADREKALADQVAEMEADYPGNGFMTGSLFEEQEMWVAAMERYSHYLEQNPDEIEMKPYLFRVYKKLMLKTLYETELAEWRQAMAQ